MNQHACYHCNLLFEAESPVPCPQCGRTLERYDAPPGAADERTQLVSPPTSLDDVPDPEMVPVSRSNQSGHVDGGRRASYGESRAQREYRGGHRPAASEPERPANRALPDAQGRPRKRNTGSLRLGRSSSPPARSNWSGDRAGRSTREVDLRSPSSPRAPRGRASEPSRRGGREEAPRADVARVDTGQPNVVGEIPRPARRSATNSDIRLPRKAPGGPADDGMESTRMLSAIDLPDGPVGGGSPPPGDGMESTRMLSAIDLAAAGAAAGPDPGAMDRTHALSPIDEEVTRFRDAPGRAPAPDPAENERTRMHGVIDLEQTMGLENHAPSGGPSPFPDPTPGGGSGPSPFPDPTPRGGSGPSPFPDPTPRGGSGPSPFPDPTPRGAPAAAQPRSDLRRAAPQPLVVPGAATPSPAPSPQPPAAATPQPVPQPIAQPQPAATPQPVPQPQPAGGRRRTRAIPTANEAPPPQAAQPTPVAAPVPQPAPVAQPAPVVQPAPVAKPADPVPDYSDKYGSYFDARGPQGANLTDAIDAIIGEQREAPPAPVGAGAVGGRRRRRSPLLWLAPIVLVAGAIIALIVIGPGGSDDEVADPVADDEGPALAGVEQVVAELGLALPRARGAEALPDDPPYVVAGAEALRVRGTQRILGVNSATVPDNVVADSPEGEWIQPLRDALGTTPRNQLDLLALALDEKVDARAVARFAQSGEKARFEEVGLVVRRVEGAGGLGVIPINTGPTEAPSAGRIMIRVGRLSVTILLETRDGPQDDPDGKIDSGGGAIDFDRVDARLAALAKAHPLVREAVVASHAELPLRDLIKLFERARTGAEKERFTRLRLVVK